MKKVFLISLFALLSFNVFAQEKFTTEDLIGYWEPNKHATQLVIWKDVNNNFQMIEFSTISGTALTLLSMQLKSNTLMVKTIFDEKKWVTESTYVFIDKNTLRCKIKGPINDTIIYTKIK
jgi:hypothetical protein